MRLLHSLLLKKISGDPVTPEIVPLTFTNTSPNDDATVKLKTTGEPVVDGIQYRLGTEGEWTPYTIGTSIGVARGESVQFQNINDRLSISASDYVTFAFARQFSASGSMRSMVNYSNEVPDYSFLKLFYKAIQLRTAPLMDFVKVGQNACENMFDGCSNLFVAPELPATEIAFKSYISMFWECTALTTPPSILPAETLYEECYANMFYGCKKLTSAPILPATTIPRYAYAYMFYYCNSLAEAPVLPGTSLGVQCYSNMFHGCKDALTTAPALPATSLNDQCYEQMFRGCENLIEAPYLPATSLQYKCYNGMFYDCKNLEKIKVNFSSWGSGSYGTGNWVYNVASNGEFECPDRLPIEFGIARIPQNWFVNGVGNIFVEDQSILQSVNEPVNFTPQYTLYPDGEVQFSIYSGSLPDGLTLNSDGSITGQASEPWQGEIVIQITGENYITRTFTLTITLTAENVKVTPNNLTSNTSNPDFVVSQRTTVGSYDAWKAMDGDITTYSKTQYESQQYDWWQIDFLKPVSVIEVYFKCYNETSSTNTYLEYSDDGINFFKYDETVITGYAEETRTYEQGVPHRYYRFLSTKAVYYILFYEIRFTYIPVDKYIGIDDFTINSVTGKEINKQLPVTIYPSDLQVNFSITEGTLPAGLTLDSSTGTITGTPTEIGEFNLTITMSAEGIESVSSSVIIKINEEGSVPDDAVVYLDGSSVTLARTGQVFAKGYSSSEVVTTTVNGYDVLHFSGETGCLITTHDVAGLAYGDSDRCISLWVQSSKTDQRQMVAYGQDSANNTWQFGKTGSRLKISGGHNISNEYYASAPGTPVDAWCHALINKIGSTEYLYYNGELLGQFTYARNTLTGKLVIGAGQDQANTTACRFKGYMTGIRIFNRSLDEAEILALSQEYTF